MGTDVETIVQIYRTYKVANAAAMNALTGMRTMELCYLDDTGEVYRYSGTAWELVISTKVGAVWKDTEETALALTNQSIDITMTDLDLTAYTSAAAKMAILNIVIHIDSYADGDINITLRKNGTAATKPVFQFPAPAAALNATFFCIIGLDSDEIMEYALSISGTAQIDLTIYVLGYFE